LEVVSNRLDNKIDLVSKRLEFVSNKLDKKIDNAVGMLAERMDSVDNKVDGLSKYVINMETKIDNNIKTLHQEIEESKNQILSREDKTIGELEIIRTELAAHSASSRQLEERINYLETVVKILAERIGVQIDANPI
jgi:hypothetical protein